MIKAIIYDLDNCLFPATIIPEDTFRSALDALRQANKGEGALAEEVLEEALAACWTHSFDEVARQYAFPEQLSHAATEAFRSLHVKARLVPYPDLVAIEELPGKRFLVTTGYRQFQQSKIATLGIAKLFDAVFIDGLDDEDRRGKEKIFREILHEYALEPAEVLVVGDNPTSEIAAGNAIGMATVQVLRPGIRKGQSATFHIGCLYDLHEIVKEIGQSGS